VGNVEVVGIETVAPESYDWTVVSPATGYSTDRHALAFTCAIGYDVDVLEVEAVIGGTALRASAPESPVNANGRTVAIEIGTAGLPLRFTLTLRAALASGRSQALSHIRIRRKPVVVDYEPRLQPVFVICMTRSGSTRLMQLLAAHPQIVAGERYPFETYPAKWWLHAAKVGSDPADFRGSIRPNHIDEDPLHVGTPVHHLIHDPHAFDWMATEGVVRAGRFALESIDGFYESYAQSLGKHDVRYFLEKRFVRPSRPDLAHDVYPHRRELMLVRDMRDVFASRVAFHRKHHGAAPMGEDPATAQRLARSMRRNLEGVLARIADRQDAVRFVRYEELVTDPGGAIANAMEFLGLEHPTAAVASAIAGDGSMGAHVTSGSVQLSVHRWQRDLAPEIVDVIRAELDDLNVQLGYV